MPLDLAFTAELERAVSPPPPSPIVIEQPWRSNAANHAQREIDRRAALDAQTFDDWRARVEAVRTRILGLDESKWSPELLTVLKNQARHGEEVAERRAIEAARAEKNFERIQRALRKRDPTLAAVHKEAARRTLLEQQQYVAEVLEFALFLRSMHSTMSNESRGGPTFSNPDDLEAYLGSVLNA